jgi:hypothetical protein
LLLRGRSFDVKRRHPNDHRLRAADRSIADDLPARSPLHVFAPDEAFSRLQGDQRRRAPSAVPVGAAVLSPPNYGQKTMS